MVIIDAGHNLIYHEPDWINLPPNQVLLVIYFFLLKDYGVFSVDVIRNNPRSSIAAIHDPAKHKPKPDFIFKAFESR